MLDGLIFIANQQREAQIFSLDKDFLDHSDSPYGYNKLEGFIEIKGYLLDDDFNEDYADVGEIHFHAYNLRNYNFDTYEGDFDTAIENSSLFEAMDVDSADTELYSSVFEQGFNNAIRDVPEIELEEMFYGEGDTYLITLDRLYINPEYRNLGIGSYIHKNLFKILYHELNIVSVFAVGICVPDSNEPANMIEVQKKVLSDNGFDIFECRGETAFCKYIYDFEFLNQLRLNW